MNNELIPSTPELEQLKSFLRVLSHLKKTSAAHLHLKKNFAALSPYTLEELMKPSKRFLEMNARVRAENRQGWIAALKGGPFPKV